ncbi:MAG: hypothetical protein OZSIB_4236 [Candidatus Ozemobacter sibiricus]|jgi:hypothetical protein|uniref:Uncharacterized protein n=1 Tax=Candidatus Ozemobacter sibiricus TaxID=2268124 RepID=A0A367ZQ28_9BACT|nr:MAG: hypothetical protein OZSIB_4236 [Candidatus Ozemobacter sibiricus]
MPLVLSLIGSLLIVALLTQMAGMSGWSGRWRPLLLRSGAALPTMGAALALEALVAAMPLVPSWAVLVVAAPLIEEGLRWWLLQATGLTEPGAGTLAGGLMGVTETAFLVARGPSSPATLAFRALATVPLHACNGGLLTQGVGSLPLAVGCHAAFNLGFVLGGGIGYLTSLTALGLLAGGWLSLTMAPPERPIPSRQA